MEKRIRMAHLSDEYYVPYFEGTGITTYADVLVERRIEKEMYVGICEDVKVGQVLFSTYKMQLST